MNTDFEVKESFGENRSIFIEDITDAVKQMPVPRGFLKEDPLQGIGPVYQDKIETIFLLMNWSFISQEENEEEGPISGPSLYAAIMKHGKTHVAETFFANEETGKYMGSHRVFSVKFPENIYNEDYDPWLMEELTTRVLGVRNQSIENFEKF